MAKNYFQRLYDLEDPQYHHPPLSGLFPVLPESDAAQMTKDVDANEIKSALFDMKPLKAPATDGIHAIFYQSQWQHVHTQLLSYIQSMWSGYQLDTSFNKTLLALIPKVATPSLISEFRPISLCTIPYKILTKVLANRLKNSLPRLIGPYQSSFITGRSIMDNIVIAQELVHSMRKKKGQGGWIAIKVDLEKAFDRRRWDFINDTLLDAGIPQQMTALIMQCISSSSMQILWNGQPSSPFLPHHGIRQGDPLSPYIFVLCMERLSQSICHAVSSGTWKPIKLGRRGDPISHLFFADDLVIFGHTTADQIAIIQSILNDFCICLGQKVSLQKTHAYFSKNVPSSTRRALSNNGLPGGCQPGEISRGPAY